MEDTEDDILDIKIVQEDNPILREISLHVENFDTELKELVTSMWHAMIARQGIGLSAVQIGVLKRVIIVRHEGEVLIMVNPVISRRLNRETVEKEGCLSIPPSKWRLVSRPAKCEVTWCDVEGKEHFRNFTGMLARIVQHEEDHLNGILITDKPIVTKR